MLHIPIFPLHTVLFPGMPLYLHIFEPRYRLMTRRCLKTDSVFGVVSIRQGVEANGPLATPYQYGVTARIMDVENLENGCMNITVVGEDRFRILELDTTQSYITGQVEGRPIENPRPFDVLRGTRELRDRLQHYLGLISHAHPTEPDLSKLELPEDTFNLLFMAAALLQLPVAEKQPLLEAETLSYLMHQLQRLFRREIAILTPMALVTEEEAKRASSLN
jgi:uncharacterized protein